jgi:uncharacterized protein (TIGR02996 family)
VKKRQGGKRAALLAAVCADPDNDAPRLAFADWLDRNGESAWAGVIRKQLVRFPELDGAPEHIRDACHGDIPEIIEAHEQVRRELPLGVTFRRLVRGFPETIHADVDTFLENADALFARLPLRALSTRTGDGALHRLADSPHLARLRGLVLGWYPADADSMRRLGAAPHAANLRSLEFSGLSDPASAVALVNCPLFPRLEELRWSFPLDHGAVGPFVEAFARLGPTRLRILEQPVCGLNAAGVVRLVNAPAAGSLKDLAMGNVPLTDESIKALSTSPRLAGLRSLSFYRSITRLPQLKTLLKGPVWRPCFLDLRWSRIGAQGVKALLDCPATQELAALDLSDNPIGDGGAKALAAAPSSSRLRYLRLLDCKIGDAGGLALAESSYLKGLAYLVLSLNTFSGEVRRALRDHFGKRVSLDWRSEDD